MSTFIDILYAAGLTFDVFIFINVPSSFSITSELSRFTNKLFTIVIRIVIPEDKL